jgi:hypothetical protein
LAFHIATAVHVLRKRVELTYCLKSSEHDTTSTTAEHTPTGRDQLKPTR